MNAVFVAENQQCELRLNPHFSVGVQQPQCCKTVTDIDVDIQQPVTCKAISDIDVNVQQPVTCKAISDIDVDVQQPVTCKAISHIDVNVQQPVTCKTISDIDVDVQQPVTCKAISGIDVGVQQPVTCKANSHIDVDVQQPVPCKAISDIDVSVQQPVTCKTFTDIEMDVQQPVTCKTVTDIDVDVQQPVTCKAISDIDVNVQQPVTCKAISDIDVNVQQPVTCKAISDIDVDVQQPVTCKTVTDIDVDVQQPVTCKAISDIDVDVQQLVTCKDISDIDVDVQQPVTCKAISDIDVNVQQPVTSKTFTDIEMDVQQPVTCKAISDIDVDVQQPVTCKAISDIDVDVQQPVTCKAISDIDVDVQQPVTCKVISDIDVDGQQPVTCKTISDIDMDVQQHVTCKAISDIDVDVQQPVTFKTVSDLEIDVQQPVTSKTFTDIEMDVQQPVTSKTFPDIEMDVQQPVTCKTVSDIVVNVQQRASQEFRIFGVKHRLSVAESWIPQSKKFHQDYPPLASQSSAPETTWSPEHINLTGNDQSDMHATSKVMIMQKSSYPKDLTTCDSEKSTTIDHPEFPSKVSNISLRVSVKQASVQNLVILQISDVSSKATDIASRVSNILGNTGEDKKDEQSSPNNLISSENKDIKWIDWLKSDVEENESHLQDHIIKRDFEDHGSCHSQKCSKTSQEGTKVHVMNFRLASEIATKLLSKITIKTIKQNMKQNGQANVLGPQSLFLQANMPNYGLQQHLDTEKVEPFELDTVINETNIPLHKEMTNCLNFNESVVDINSWNLNFVKKSDGILRTDKDLKHKDKMDAKSVNPISEIHENSRRIACSQSAVGQNDICEKDPVVTADCDGVNDSSAQKESGPNFLKATDFFKNFHLASEITKKLLAKVTVNKMNQNIKKQNAQINEVPDFKSFQAHKNAKTFDQQHLSDIDVVPTANVGIVTEVNSMLYSRCDSVHHDYVSSPNSYLNTEESSTCSNRKDAFFLKNNLFEEDESSKDFLKHEDTSSNWSVPCAGSQSEDLSQDNCCIIVSSSSNSSDESHFPERSSEQKLKKISLPLKFSLPQTSSSSMSPLHKVAQSSLFRFGFTSDHKDEKVAGLLSQKIAPTTSSFKRQRKQKKPANPVSKTRCTVYSTKDLTKEQVPVTPKQTILSFSRRHI